MQSQTLHKSISAAVFESFLEALAGHLQLESGESLPDGVGDVDSGGVPVSLAVQRSQRFVAARWACVDENGLAQHETFFVQPKGIAARTGYRIRRYAGPLSPFHAPDGGGTRLEAPAWWSAATATGAPIETGTLPTFVELLATLCGEGRVKSTNPELLARLNAQEDEANYLLTLLDEQKRQLKQYRARLRSLEAATGNADAQADEVVVDIDGRLPDLESLPAWAAENRERIVVLPRALNGVKKSRYERPEVVCAAFELLAGTYRDTRLGLAKAEDLDAAMSVHGLKLEGSVGASIAGEQGSAYFVRWDGRRRMLDLHLLKGGGRDERYCMRLYFFWDAESSRVVVGSGVAHLANSLS
ncbi:MULTISPECIES: hypothetical protein [unclassified Variovorax]|uniref:hypothetical protein n=1 Tax=unclassified Variovorax TaxID=663243 RepID=UPI001315AFCA|nr:MULTISPECIES: hypothetical protein [unclassified Variovorax]VTU41926.1 hypothetical protein SRS16P1_00157 [Variovorax sp. SRS16]VTU41955.1 hypothetical protein E5P1_00155 [Variovorax sp. PBL-E5]VTU44507.1 hypothetical protein H6P1_00777 [Variovorax sp. PBL-H6]